MKLRIKGDIQVYKSKECDGWYAEVEVDDGDEVEVQLTRSRDEVVERAYLVVGGSRGIELVYAPPAGASS